MSKSLLKKAQVASGKTAGIVARETLAMAKRAGDMPCVIKEKTIEAIQVTGKTLRIKRLKNDLKKWEKKRLAIYPKMGEVIFKLVEGKAKNIEQKKDVKGFLHELRECEAEIRKIKAEITQAEKSSKEQIDYRTAVLNLSAKEKDVRLLAVKSLEHLGDKDIIPILTKRLEDPDLRVRQETARVLHKIIEREYPHHEASGSEPGQRKVKDNG